MDGEEVGGGEQERRVLTLAEHKTLAEMEMDRWIKYPIPFNDLNGSPLAWWALPEMQLNFPYFSNLARRLLSIPASSAKVERVFSQSGLVLTDLRTKMGMDTLEDLLVLKYHQGDGHVYMTPRQWAAMELYDEDEEGKGNRKRKKRKKGDAGAAAGAGAT